mgnify:CR=1 FL=1
MEFHELMLKHLKKRAQEYHKSKQSLKVKT